MKFSFLLLVAGSFVFAASNATIEGSVSFPGKCVRLETVFEQPANPDLSSLLLFKALENQFLPTVDFDPSLFRSVATGVFPVSVKTKADLLQLLSFPSDERLPAMLSSITASARKRLAYRTDEYSDIFDTFWYRRHQQFPLGVAYFFAELAIRTFNVHLLANLVCSMPSLLQCAFNDQKLLDMAIHEESLKCLRYLLTYFPEEALIPRINPFFGKKSYNRTGVVKAFVDVLGVKNAEAVVQRNNLVAECLTDIPALEALLECFGQAFVQTEVLNLLPMTQTSRKLTHQQYRAFLRFISCSLLLPLDTIVEPDRPLFFVLLTLASETDYTFEIVLQRNRSLLSQQVQVHDVIAPLLYVAAVMKNPAAIRMLLEAGTDINARYYHIQDPNNTAPVLHAIVSYGDNDRCFERTVLASSSLKLETIDETLERIPENRRCLGKYVSLRDFRDRKYGNHHLNRKAVLAEQKRFALRIKMR